MFIALLTAFVLVAIAEFGDKTQMLTLVLAARHGARSVLLGVALAVVALQLLAVAAGGLVGTLLPAWLLAWVTGLAFIGFGVWTLLARGDEDVEEEAGRAGGRGPVLGTAGAFFLAELGDKTQVMTMAIAADPAAASRTLGLSSGAGSPGMLVAVWVGSTLAMLAVNGAAAAVGGALGSKLSPRLIATVSGVVFIGFGVLAIATQLLGG